MNEVALSGGGASHKRRVIAYRRFFGRLPVTGILPSYACGGNAHDPRAKVVGVARLLTLVRSREVGQDARFLFEADLGGSMSVNSTMCARATVRHFVTT